MQHPENQLQQACITWFRYQYPNQSKRLFMIHNNPKSERDGARLKAAGMLRGVSDLCYRRGGGRVAFIELKVGKNKLSPAQKEFRDDCELLGDAYHVAYTLEEFIKIISDYNLDNTENIVSL
jgi:hypothetical protein